MLVCASIFMLLCKFETNILFLTTTSTLIGRVGQRKAILSPKSKFYVKVKCKVLQALNELSTTPWRLKDAWRYSSTFFTSRTGCYYGNISLYGVLKEYRTGDLPNTTYSSTVCQWKQNCFSPRQSLSACKPFSFLRTSPYAENIFFAFVYTVSSGAYISSFILIWTQLFFLTVLFYFSCSFCFEKKWNCNPDEHNCMQEPSTHPTFRFGSVEMSTNAEGPAYCGLGNEQ
jgi:hypothetical protein